MDSTQLATLKAYILAQPDLSPLVQGATTDRYACIAALNANADPTKLAWKESVPATDADEAADYSTFDSIQAGKRDSWAFFLNFSRDFTRLKVRKWVTDVWGNATAGSNAENILLAGTEKASRAEVALGGTDKTTGTVTAINRNWTGDGSSNAPRAARRCTPWKTPRLCAAPTATTR